LKHVLLDCVDVSDVRQNFYNVNNLCDLFTNVADDTILKFLKEIDLTNVRCEMNSAKDTWPNQRKTFISGKYTNVLWWTGGVRRILP
jgi:hypothetical protein